MKFDLQIAGLFERFQELTLTHTEDEVLEILSREYMKSLNTPSDIIADISKQTEYTLIEILNSDEDSYNIKSLYEEGILIEDSSNLDTGYSIDGLKLIEKIKREVVNRHFEKLPKEYHLEANYTIRDKLSSEPIIFFNEKGSDSDRFIKNKSNADIDKFGIMRDKTVQALLKEPSDQSSSNGLRRQVWGVKQFEFKNQPVPTYITLSYKDDDPNTKISTRLTSFDHAVYDAISSIYCYHEQRAGGEGILYVTPVDIWRAMNGGNYSNTFPTSKQVNSVIASVDKMRFTNIIIDMSAEAKLNAYKFNDDDIKYYVKDDYYLDAGKHEFFTNKGTKAWIYEIRTKPIFYAYNEAKGHVSKVDPSLLDTACGNEGKTVELRLYLLLQIELMYDKERDSTKMLYTTIYTDSGVEPPEERVDKSKYSNEKAYKSSIRKQKKKDRDKINAILDAWKSKGYIADYQASSDGVNITLVEEELERRTPRRKSRKK